MKEREDTPFEGYNKFFLLYNMSTLFQKLKSLPQSPGVYIFYGGKSAGGGFRKARVLYVGKAASLKDRVGSYFRATRDLTPSPSPYKGEGGRPIEMFISEVKDLEIRKTDTVLEAYILEQNLIKEMQPKYNIDGKDDKSFCYVLVTKEDYPRLVVARKTELNNFVIASEAKQSRSNMEKLNSARLPRRSEDGTPRNGEVVKIYGPYTSKKQIETVLKILRKIFPYHSRPEKSEKRCFDYHIGLCPGPHDGAISKINYKKNIKAIQMILEGKKNNLVKKMKKEMLTCSDKREFECAAKLRNQMFALQHIQDVALITNRDEKFQIPSTKSQINSNYQNSKFQTFRIEGYDVSNISGKHSVGSMIVFDNTDEEIKANKSQYRKFKIKTIAGANDVGAMEEILMRRFRNNWKLPNLIILDGGRGHLNMARRVLRIYHLEIPLLAVAKGPTRKKLDFYSFGTLPKIPKNIIEQIRDEAHRFAISYHRDLRGREIIRG